MTWVDGMSGGVETMLLDSSNIALLGIECGLLGIECGLVGCDILGRGDMLGRGS